MHASEKNKLFHSTIKTNADISFSLCLFFKEYGFHSIHAQQLLPIHTYDLLTIYVYMYIYTYVCTYIYILLFVCVQSLLPCSIVLYNENTTFRYVYKNARRMLGVLSMLLTKAKR